MLGLDTNKHLDISPKVLPNRNAFWNENVTRMLHSSSNFLYKVPFSECQKPNFVPAWRLKFAFKIENMYRRLGWDKKAKKIGICANTVQVRRELESQMIYVSGIRCHDRVCPICNSFRASKLARRVEDVMVAMKNPHFLTITNSNRVQELKENFDLFLQKMSKLRRANFFKKNISGGLYFIEFTKNNDGWHIHSHMLVDVKVEKKIYNLSGSYYNLRVSEFKQGLEKSLQKVSLGSISSINPCFPGTGKEISKYLAKMGLDMQEDDIRDLVISLKNRRICGSFGSVRKTGDIEKQIEVEKDFEVVGSISDCVSRWWASGYKLGSDVVLELVRSGFIEINFENFENEYQIRTGERGG